MNLANHKLLIIFFASMIVILGIITFTPPTASIGVTLAPGAYMPYIVQKSTPVAGPLPDLIVPYASITLEDPTCYDGHSSMGLRVFIDNIDQGDAGLFVLDIDQTSVTVDGLAGGSSTSVWIQRKSYKPLIMVDATDLVFESDEGNNVFNEILPVPTRPVPCSFLTATPDFSDVID